MKRQNETMKSHSESDRPTPSRADADAIPLLTERLYVTTLPPVIDEAEADAVQGAVKDAAAADVPATAADAAPVEVQPAVDIAVALADSPVGPTTVVPPAQPMLDIGVVRDALLDDLERILPGQIESMIRREVSNAIDDAVFRVVAETQDALARAVGQVVERAVREELNRLRNEGG
jgi:Flp pilus assembly protein TadG